MKRGVCNVELNIHLHDIGLLFHLSFSENQFSVKKLLVSVMMQTNVVLLITGVRGLPVHCVGAANLMVFQTVV